MSARQHQLTRFAAIFAGASVSALFALVSIVAGADQIITGTDGKEYRQAGISTIYYAGDGKFSYEMDLMNMGHINQDLKEAGWAPKGEFNMPPRNPNRDYSRG